MSKQSLAVKYRPKIWDDITEQKYIKVILENQIKTNTIKNAYLFCRRSRDSAKQQQPEYLQMK